MNGQQPYQQPPMQQQPMEKPAPQGGARIGLYILSFIIGIVGIILGIIYLIKPDKDAKKFGMICLILGILGPIIWVVIWWIVAATIFTAAVSTVPYYY